MRQGGLSLGRWRIFIFKDQLPDVPKAALAEKVGAHRQGFRDVHTETVEAMLPLHQSHQRLDFVMIVGPRHTQLELGERAAMQPEHGARDEGETQPVAPLVSVGGAWWRGLPGRARARFPSGRKAQGLGVEVEAGPCWEELACWAPPS